MKVEFIEINLKSRQRGFHLIDDEINSGLEKLNAKNGILNLFINHTSAAITINENADPTVRADFETFFNRLVPESAGLYKHSYEGLDDATSHIKASIFGASLNIPIKEGKLKMGTWQGIYLCEFRNRANSRKLTLTFIGE